jgi:UDP-glucuronate 4-epimerase
MTAEEHFLVTGAMGCIGAWTVANLVRDGAAVTAYDLGTDPYRLGYLLDESELEKINFVQGDIADLEALEQVVVDGRISHIIHLAALQVPFCRADPMLGARVNVSGTVNVFEVAKRHQEQVQQLVYASSAAVYGPNTAYDVSPAPVDAEMAPGTIYGVYKLANEGTARIYWQDDGVSSIGLRPYIVYGVGRDQGMTSGPSKAMLAAAAGRPFHIPHGGRADYQWADDAARTFIACARKPNSGAAVHNLKRNDQHMSDIVAAIKSAVPAAAGQITFEAGTLIGLPDSLDDSSLVAFLDDVPDTLLAEGVGRTIEQFRSLVRAGRIDVESNLL